MANLLRESDLVPGVAGVAALLGATFALDLPLVAATGIGALVYAGVGLVMPAADPEVAPGVRRSQLAAGVAALEARIAHVAALTGQVSDREARRHVARIVDVARQVVAHVLGDPADLPAAQPLLELYLDTTTGLLRTYVHLASRDVVSARDALEKAENEAIPLLSSKVTALYEQLQRPEVVALTVDSELVEFRTRGLTEGIG